MSHYKKIIFVKAGNGGNGCLSFRREKYLPKGGPNGGDGGNGGSLLISKSKNIENLNYFVNFNNYFAENGKDGSSRNKTGLKGKDLILHVPLNTSIYIYNDEDEELLIDENNDKFVIDNGGKGGLGNLNFKSSTNQAPRRVTQGQRKNVIKLKLIQTLSSDICILGLPNSGKSSLFNILTNKLNSKVDSYPFTTTEINQGVIKNNNTFENIIILDFPAIDINNIENNKFIRHINDSKLILLMIDLSDNNFEKNNQFLEIIKSNIKNIKYIVIYNKLDIKNFNTFKNIKLLENSSKNFFISCKDNTGINEIKEFIFNLFSQ